MRAFTLATLLLVAPTVAHAHGRPPIVTEVAFVPGAPDRIVARGTWGLVASDDDGASWYWICAAAYNVDATVEDPDYLLNPDGSILIASFGGLYRGRADRCEWSQPDPDLDNVYVIDLDAAGDDRSTIYAVETNGGGPDQLHVSFDEGLSFDPVGAPIDEVLIERVRVAPSDPMRLYLSGAQPVSMDNPTRRGFFYRSEDAGQTLTRFEVPLVDEEKNVHLLAVDPTAPERVLVRITRRPIDERPERVLLTEDGGDSFTTVLQAQRISGAAFSADGSRVWITSKRGDNADVGPETGLWRSDDGGETFAMLNGRDLTCVADRGGELWTCASELAEGFSLARSDNGGDSFTEALRFEQIVELPACDSCSKVGFTCPNWFPDLAFDLQLDAGTTALPDGSVTGAPRDAAPPAMCSDGSVPLDGGSEVIRDGGPGVDGDGCGCRAAGRGGSPGALFALIALLWLRRRPFDASTIRSVH